MQKFTGYDEIQVNEGFKVLPAGPYKCIIKKATEEAKQSGKGTNLVILFDIAEGDNKGHFKDDFDKQTNSKKWRGIYRIGVPENSSSEGLKKLFKSLITSIEKSNAGWMFGWDDKSIASMKDKKIGFVFGEEEYLKDGQVKVAVKPFFPRTYDTVLDADTPERKKIAGGTTPTSVSGTQSAWTPSAPVDDDDLPF